MKKLTEILKAHFEKFGTTRVDELAEGITRLMLDYAEHAHDPLIHGGFYNYKSNDIKFEVVEEFLIEKLEGIKTMTIKKKADDTSRGTVNKSKGTTNT